MSGAWASGRWISHLATEGGRYWERKGRDGIVRVERPLFEKRWHIYVDGADQTGLTFASAREAMEHVNDVEAHA